MKSASLTSQLYLEDSLFLFQHRCSNIYATAWTSTRAGRGSTLKRNSTLSFQHSVLFSTLWTPMHFLCLSYCLESHYFLLMRIPLVLYPEGLSVFNSVFSVLGTSLAHDTTLDTTCIIATAWREFLVFWLFPTQCEQCHNSIFYPISSTCFFVTHIFV